MANEDYWDNPTDDSSGLLGHFVGKVLDSFWSNAAQESQGKATGDWAETTQLYWNVELLDIMQEDFGGQPPETLFVQFGIGKKYWPDTENENFVEHEDDTEDNIIKFKGQSGIGKILSMVAGKGKDALGQFKVEDGGGDVQVDFSGLKEYFQAEKVGMGEVRDARIWQGLVFEFRGLAFPTRDNANPRMKAIPVRFIGVDSEDNPLTTEAIQEKMSQGKGGGHGRRGGSGRQAAADKPPSQHWLDAGADKSTAKQLDKLAHTAKDYAGFATNAVLLKAVKDSEGLLAAVNDEANYTATVAVEAEGA